jgi:hypothetical protein
LVSRTAHSQRSTRVESIPSQCAVPGDGISVGTWTTAS